MAWGNDGHKIICEIAMRRVSAESRIEIARLMSTDQDFTSFAEACTWADHPRKRAAEHFLNLPRDELPPDFLDTDLSNRRHSW